MTMPNIYVFSYLLLLLATLLLGAYNFIYEKEAKRTERSSGITLPAYVHTMLKTITTLSFILAIIIGVLGLYSLFTSRLF